jgi:phosphonate transport system substrate-binding protein
MFNFFKYGILALLVIFARPVLAESNQSAKSLDVGVVPYLSARVLIGIYEPMRLYLEHALGKPVRIYTAPGFRQFYLNAKRGDYDLVISAAHFARILQKDEQFKPLLRYSAGGRSLIMTAHDSHVKSAQDLRGKIIAVPDKLSLAAIVSMTLLHENNLQPDIDYTLMEVPSFASAILSVQKGEAFAAISAQGALAQMPRELRESVIPVIDSGEFLSHVFLTHPRLDKNYTDRLTHELLKFGNDTKEGKQFLTSIGFGTIIPATAKDMSSLDRYVAVTKRLLGESQ